jgi:hypothetical protein
VAKLSGFGAFEQPTVPANAAANSNLALELARVTHKMVTLTVRQVTIPVSDRLATGAGNQLGNFIVKELLVVAVTEVKKHTWHLGELFIVR